MHLKLGSPSQVIGFGHERSLRRQLTAQWQFDKEKKRNELILNRNLPKSAPEQRSTTYQVTNHDSTAAGAAQLNLLH